jgi:hypothetical protein
MFCADVWLELSPITNRNQQNNKKNQKQIVEGWETVRRTFFMFWVGL